MKRLSLKQHWKMLLIISGSLIALLLVLLLGSKLILLDSFVRLEKENMQKNMERAMNALQGELSHLSSITGDYAGWDDSYRFIQDGNKDFVNANTPDTIFPTLRINMLIFVKNSGQIVYSRGYDREKKEGVPLPDSLLGHISNKSPLVVHTDTKSIVTGVLTLPQGFMLVVSRPVLTNDYKGPIHGALIMGRYLDADELDLLATNTRLSLSVYQIDKGSMPADVAMVRDELSGSGPALVRPLSKESVAAYALVKDIYDKGAFVFKVDAPRSIYRQGIETIRYIFLWFLVVGVIFSIVSFLLFEKLEFVRRKEKESEERYRSVVKQAAEGILMVSMDDKRIIEGNKAFYDLIGYTPKEAASMTLYDITPAERQRVDSEAGRILREKREIRLRHKDGSFIETELSANQISYQDKDVLCLVVYDITERKRFEEQLMHQATHDSLTGLANRNLLNDRLTQAIAYQKRKNQIIAVMLLDLDEFKIINDTMGHHTGDVLLQEVAERLQKTVRSYDTVARLGGDEFVIIFADVANTQDIITIAKNILNLL